MKKIIKITSLILSITYLSMFPVLASEIENTVPHSFYNSFTGTVNEIEKIDDVITKVYLEDEEGIPTYFVLNDNTYYADDVKIGKGEKITGYYESGKPMILIYPPQYTIDIVMPVYKDGFVKADKFDSKLLSRDGQLKLNISEETKIIWENGTEINWVKQPTPEELETLLSNRKLIVYYDITTKSIPAQTTPNKIIVLSQQIEDKIRIAIDDIIIDTPSAYISEAGNVMVPVRIVSEALGYEVTWNNDEKSVQIGSDISFKIGENNVLSGTSILSLEEASVLNEDHAFVPLGFFIEVLKVKEVSFFENNIIMNSAIPLAE